MKSSPRLDDSDDLDSDRRSTPRRPQNFTKSGKAGTKDFSLTQTMKYGRDDDSNLKLNLKHINDANDSLDDSDDETNTKTGRSTSSGTTSQLTPKPKERSFMKGDSHRPVVKPRKIDIDDDDRSPFGSATMKSSPRQQILTLKEEDERDSSFARGFTDDFKRKSSPDIFASNGTRRARGNNKAPSSSRLDASEDDSDDNRSLNKQTGGKFSRNIQPSPPDTDRLESRKSSHRSSDHTDNSDEEDHKKFHSQTKLTNQMKKRQSSDDLTQGSHKDNDFHNTERQQSSSRPGSANRHEFPSSRRDSYHDDQENVAPIATSHKSQSRPTSAKSNTMRQQTGSAIDAITSANIPPSHNQLTSNNEALAAEFQTHSLPPKYKKSQNEPTRRNNKKEQFKVSSRYKDITSRVDDGRKPVSQADLKRSIERALEKELKSKTMPRPQSARSRNNSANSTSSSRTRRRSTSAYEHVQPRVNTNRSINFDQLNTSQMRAESSQSIKDGVYYEWLIAKEEERKRMNMEKKRWKEEREKRIDKSKVERDIQQSTENLQRWREEKERQMRIRKEEERKLRQEKLQEEKEKKERKKADSTVGFVKWEEQKKEDDLKRNEEQERKKKAEIERKQAETVERTMKADKAYKEWMTHKDKNEKKIRNLKTQKENELKNIRKEEENKFVSAQEAYERWLEKKEKWETENDFKVQRRNSLSQQQKVPFLPGGGQRNTGKVRHVPW